MSLPSLETLKYQTELVAYYPLTVRLSSDYEQELKKTCHVKYFMIASPEAQKCWAKTVMRPETLNVNEISSVSQEDFADFTMATFFSRFPSHYGISDRNQFLGTIPQYFKEQPLFGKSYKKAGRIVGVIVAHLYGRHPAINERTLHVGYWGYERSLVNAQEARFIKQDWFSSLLEWSLSLGGVSVDASIDWFNSSAYRMVTERGFELKCLRLDKKPS